MRKREQIDNRIRSEWSKQNYAGIENNKFNELYDNLGGILWPELFLGVIRIFLTPRENP